MKNIILSDTLREWTNFLPLSYTRPLAEIRIGICTIYEKWRHYFPDAQISYLTQDYLQEKFPINIQPQNLVINAAVLPDQGLVKSIISLDPGEGLRQGDLFIAGNYKADTIDGIDFRTALESASNFSATEFQGNLTVLGYTWDIFLNNAGQIRSDFEIITRGRPSQPLDDPFSKIYGQDNLFMEEGASIRAAVIDADSGPVYLGKGARIQEGAVVRGPFAMGEGSSVSMGAKIRGDSSIGPHCKIGGEIANSVMFGYSNKAHDGYLGNSVIGTWCNLGADTNVSNLKNNYANVKVYNYLKNGFVDTGLQFCGLLMGDHSKCGINTMFNTGTMVGVSCNLFGSGYPRSFIPAFSWGGASGMVTYRMEKAIDTMEKVMMRRNIPLDEIERRVLENIFELTSPYRN